MTRLRPELSGSPSHDETLEIDMLNTKPLVIAIIATSSDLRHARHRSLGQGDPALGALLGAGIGAAIGNSVNHHNGAWVGGAIGAVAGASIAANAGGYYGSGYGGTAGYYGAPAPAYYSGSPAYYVRRRRLLRPAGRLSAASRSTWARIGPTIRPYRALRPNYGHGRGGSWRGNDHHWKRSAGQNHDRAA